MKSAFVCLPLFVLMSCGDSASDQPARDTARAGLNPKVTSVQSYRPNIEFTPWEGDLYDAIYWRDSRGENAYIVSGKPQYFWEKDNPDAMKYFPEGEDKETLSELTEIFGIHYVLKPGEPKWKVHYKYHDFLFGCCDVWMEYQPASLTVADADSNGVGEPMFMFHETEADGKLEHNYVGTLMLERDSSIYEIQDETGLGEAKRREKHLVYSDKIILNLPSDSTYSKWMLSKWEELWNKKVEQDREEITNKNNVDEQGHADHVH